MAGLRALDVELWLNGDRLRYNAPAGVLTASLRAELTERREEIVAFLRRNRDGDAWPPLRRFPRDENLPLSFAQKRMWFLAQWAPETPAYNIPVALRISGPLDLQILERSFNEVISRQEALRTTCRYADGSLQAVVMPNVTLAIPVVDLGRLAAAGRERAFLRRARAEAREPLDLTRGPLLRVTAYRFDDEEYGLMVTTHHFVADGWSVRLLFREIRTIYEALLNDREPTLEELPIQYVDFAQWQRERVAGGALNEQLGYWKERLEGAPDLLKIPTDRPRPAEQSYRGATRSFSVPAELAGAIVELSRRERVTPFTTFLAAFQTLLHRYTQESDIVVGSAVSARERSELEPVIGTFANNVVLRTDFSGNLEFREALQRVRQTTLGAFAHQEIPFEWLIDELNPRRDLSRSPLFQVFFLLHRAGPGDVLQLPGCRIRSLELDTGTSKFDLSLSLTKREDGFTGAFEYSTDLFDDDTIGRMAGHFSTLLESIVVDPERSIGTLPLLTAAEETRLLTEWQASEVRCPDVRGHEMFVRQAARRPEAVAVEFEGMELTYAELDARSNRLARYLRARGVHRDVTVGLCVERSLEMVVGMLGILKAGGAYVPLDPSYPAERLSFVLEETRAPVVLSQEALLGRLTEQARDIVCLDREAGRIARESEDELGDPVDPEDLAYVIYTSGSTGRPKGVEIPHRALTNFLDAMRREPGLTEDDRLLAVTTISFDIAALELLLPLAVGARVTIVPREVTSDGARLSEALARSGATVMQATPATWRLLLDAGWAGDRNLKVLCGGEALTRDLADRLLDRCGPVWNLYGPTETTIWSTVQRVEPGPEPVPIGRPIANTRIYVLDPNGQPVPVGVPGELHIGGLGLARGYHRRPEQTAERFVEDPFRDDGTERLYRTGDRVRYRADGRLEFLGRLDDQLKLRGFRIEPAEIERALAAHPSVAKAVAVMREYGPGDQRLIGYFTPTPGRDEPTGTELRSFLRHELPEYMVPSIYVPLEELPLTPNGKIDRKALPEPKLLQVRRGTVYEPPRTEAELTLARIWKDLLGTDRVGRNDNFFDLGGHSLLSVQAIFRTEDAFDIRFTPRDMALSTLGQLAAECQRCLEDRAKRGPSRLGALRNLLSRALNEER